MAKIFITGSTDGLGLLTGQLLLQHGHEVIFHARNPARAQDACKKYSRIKQILTADLANVAETKSLAEQVNALGVMDAVIHNAGVYQASTQDLLAVNTFAPYLLTCLIHKPSRLIYLTSGMHLQGKPRIETLKTPRAQVSYSDTKLQVMMLTCAVARLWPDVYCNAVNPGWVPTRMGGAGAPDDLQKGYETQAWLATTTDSTALVSGRYFFHQQVQHHHAQADDSALQQSLITCLQEITGVPFPA